MSASAQDDALRRLLAIGRTLMAELDPEVVLNRVLDGAREVTGARYAAIGVLTLARNGLERFLTAGLDHAATLRAIGGTPRGRGVLGVLIEDPRPLRLADVSQHPSSYGFPPRHPPMRTFLGVPIVIRGEAWGNLYLTEKRDGGEFSSEDEEAAVMLAQWAAIAVENARLYAASEQRRDQLERAVRSLRAAGSITEAIGSVDDLDRILELIVAHGRPLIDAQSLLIMLCEGDELVVAASAGNAIGAPGHRLPISGSTSGQVLEAGLPRRITDVASRLLVAPDALGVADAHTALLVPMIHRGTRVGVLAAFDRGRDGRAFGAEDEQLLRTFAQAAANAVAISRGVEAARLRSAIAAADAERGRWARELHDQTLQSLGGLRVLLASAHRRHPDAATGPAIAQAIEDTESEIANLRAIISDLRPSLLDDLGLRPALESLLERRRASGLTIDGELALPDDLGQELQSTIYRVVQEALTNVVKHARADAARVQAQLDGEDLIVEISDDGIGFDTSSQTAGFGLAGMRERVYLAGGTLQVTSDRRGTIVHARIPAGQRASAGSHGHGLPSP
ncbi:MAG: sensor histidine kinase [Solirubrobacteraceae bacterium]